jgi:AmmeMemoRadiSam system protein B
MARKAMFAGSWYPSQASQCEQQIQEYLYDIPVPDDIKTPVVGGIVPHAGWYFSGAIACRVIQLLSEAPPPDALVVFGMHLRPGAANRIMTSGSWETPFGDIPIAAELADFQTKRFSFKIETDTDFTPDNTIELQLPFIRYFFPDVPIIPIGVPPDTASLSIGETAVSIASETGMSLKVLGSTDLTHYGPNYGFSPHGNGDEAVSWVRDENDRNIIEAIVDMDPERVLSEAASRFNACCAGAVATTITAAKALGAVRGHKLAYTTSYDKSPGDSLVGYVGVVF